ncbi:MAG: hypothetical protein PHD65_01995 [Gallionella sp.]|nr:hypothetical protein [Gallionella sp.]
MGASKNPHFIPTAALRKKFLAYISIYAALQNFFRALHLGEIWIFRGSLIRRLIQIENLWF